MSVVDRVGGVHGGNKCLHCDTFHEQHETTPPKTDIRQRKYWPSVSTRVEVQELV